MRRQRIASRRVNLRPDRPALWGSLAASVPVTAMLWMLLSVMRGALQGFGHYRTVAISIVGESTGRLLLGLALVGLGLDVTGAFLGTPLSLAVVAALLAFQRRA